MRLLDKIESEDIFFLLVIAGILFVLVILAVGSVFSDDSGPATDSVEACAEIDDAKASVACFEAIGADR